MNHYPPPNRDDANRAARENEIEQDRREHVARCADTPNAGSLTVSYTPRTDKVTFLECGEDMFVVVQADFARELERENAALREAGEALRNALAFECQKLGDRPREIEAWDALTSQLKP